MSRYRQDFSHLSQTSASAFAFSQFTIICNFHNTRPDLFYAVLCIVWYWVMFFEEFSHILSAWQPWSLENCRHFIILSKLSLIIVGLTVDCIGCWASEIIGPRFTVFGKVSTAKTKFWHRSCYRHTHTHMCNRWSCNSLATCSVQTCCKCSAIVLCRVASTLH